MWHAVSCSSNGGAQSHTISPLSFFQSHVPWLIRRGQRAGFDDENAKPFFVATLTIKLKKPRVFVMECARVSTNSKRTCRRLVICWLRSPVWPMDTRPRLQTMAMTLMPCSSTWKSTWGMSSCSPFWKIAVLPISIFPCYAPGRDMNSRVLPVMIHSYGEPCHVTLSFHVFNWHAHVMSCHVMSCDVMSWESCHEMSCHVMSCHEMSCHVMRCHVMPCHDMSGSTWLACDVPWWLRSQVPGWMRSWKRFANTSTLQPPLVETFLHSWAFGLMWIGASCSSAG